MNSRQVLSLFLRAYYVPSSELGEEEVTGVVRCGLWPHIHRLD